MGYISIPKNYTASPSSFMGTPALTINHEATQGLDSSNAFEGKFFSFFFSGRLVRDYADYCRSRETS